MNHRALASVVFPDPRGGKPRVSHEIIDPTRARMIPKPHVMRRQRKDKGDRKPHRSPVFRIHIPYVSHRRVTIANMAGVWRGDHSFRGPGFGADHQIIVAEIKLLQREWLKKQQMAMKILCSWYPLQKGSLQLSGPQNRSECGMICD